MRNWISKGGETTAIAVAMLFLRVIADDLVPGDVASSRFLIELSTARRSVSEVASFLADVYDCIHSTFALPADTQSELQIEFTDCLSSWARVAIDTVVYRTTAEDLFVALAAVRGKMIREELYTLLGSNAFLDDDEMRAFAVAVRKRLDN